MEIDFSDLLLIVVGAHLRAELEDRSLGYRLRDQIRDWRVEQGFQDDPGQPVLCTDLWYLNHQDLLLQPTIALGDPEVNAATAFLASRIPTAFVVEGVFRVQLDPELVDLKVCLWGTNAQATAQALEVFTERHLDGYLRSAHDLGPR